MDVGFIGLGNMGLAMARNIARAGHRVRAWNRTSRPGDAEGLERVATARAAFDADVVFTMLSDDAALRAAVLDADLLSAARPGTVHVGSSTISVAFADELLARHRAAGVGYVSAPVFGRPEAAEAAQLNIVAAGDAAAIAQAQPLFDVIGRKTWIMGSDPKQANVAKIAGNMMLGLAVEALAEATVLTEGHGLSSQDFRELMTSTLFAAPAYQAYSAKMGSGDFTPGFRMTLGLKDLRLATEASEAVGCRLPALEAVRGRMSDAVAAGYGDQDWSAIVDYARKRQS